MHFGIARFAVSDTREAAILSLLFLLELSWGIVIVVVLFSWRVPWFSFSTKWVRLRFFANECHRSSEDSVRDFKSLCQTLGEHHFSQFPAG